MEFQTLVLMPLFLRFLEGKDLSVFREGFSLKANDGFEIW
jgi:hypothetical protein